MPEKSAHGKAANKRPKHDLWHWNELVESPSTLERQPRSQELGIFSNGLTREAGLTTPDSVRLHEDLRGRADGDGLPLGGVVAGRAEGAEVEAEVRVVDRPVDQDAELDALVARIIGLFTSYAGLHRDVPEDALAALQRLATVPAKMYFVASQIAQSVEVKQNILRHCNTGMSLRTLTGSHFIVCAEPDLSIGGTTLPAEALRGIDAALSGAPRRGIALLAFTAFLPTGRRLSLDALQSSLDDRHEKRDEDLNDRSNPIDVPADAAGATQPMDTGFMVFNEVTYPHL